MSKYAVVLYFKTGHLRPKYNFHSTLFVFFSEVGGAEDAMICGEIVSEVRVV